MTLAYSRLVAVFVFIAALAGPARADNTQRAKELFQEGTTLFNVGDFDKAIEAWQQGYKEKPDPGFLYNIGQAYRLKGDAPKAIFFYRGYLRNSPKAANRADVEAKIATLQKGEEHPGTPPGQTPPPVTAPPVSTSPPPSPPVAAPPRATPPPPPRPAPVQARPVPVAPPPVAAPPLPTPVAPSVSPVGVVEVSAPPPERDVIRRNRPFDITLSPLGISTWTSGLRISGDAPAQYTLGAGVGYTFGRNVFGPASFRLGAGVTWTKLQEGSGNKSNTLNFTSVLLEPSARIRLVDRRLYLTAGLGIGFVVISGVQGNSVVLVLAPSGKSLEVSGTQGGLELRPAVGLQFHFTDWLAVFASPALAFTPKKPNYYGTLGRFELMFGVTILL